MPIKRSPKTQVRRRMEYLLRQQQRTRKRSKVGQAKRGRGLDKSMVTEQEGKALRQAAGIKRKPRKRSAY